MTDNPKKQFGGKQEGAGRKPSPNKIRQVSLGVESDLYDFLQSLPRPERQALLHEAKRVLRMAEINSRIL